MTIGEMVIQGPTVMLGYLKDKEAMSKAIRRRNDNEPDWFYIGDLAVMHKDGYLEIKDWVERRDYKRWREHKHRAGGIRDLHTQE